jgi:hypothetical protein
MWRKWLRKYGNGEIQWLANDINVTCCMQCNTYLFYNENICGYQWLLYNEIYVFSVNVNGSVYV